MRFGVGEAEDRPLAPMIWYFGSKKFAELASLDVAARLHPTYTLASICPPIILGPEYHTDKFEKTGFSGQLQAGSLTGGTNATVPDTHFPSGVDVSSLADIPDDQVRDVAKALFNIISRRAKGRYLLDAGPFDFQVLANIGHQVRPDLANFIPKAHTPTPMDQGVYRSNVSKAEKQLGMSWIPLETTVKDTLARMEDLGAFVAA